MPLELAPWPPPYICPSDKRHPEFCVSDSLVCICMVLSHINVHPDNVLLCFTCFWVSQKGYTLHSLLGAFLSAKTLLLGFSASHSWRHSDHIASSRREEEKSTFNRQKRKLDLFFFLVSCTSFGCGSVLGLPRVTAEMPSFWISVWEGSCAPGLAALLAQGPGMWDPAQSPEPHGEASAPEEFFWCFWIAHRESFSPFHPKYGLRLWKAWEN